MNWLLKRLGFKKREKVLISEKCEVILTKGDKKCRKH